jgi:hypothetical protein
MPRDQLFGLIKSLTPHEKGYIRRMAFVHQQSGENNYLRLFDAIDQQKTYDEAALRKKLEKDQLMKNFPGAKNYLQNVILRHLESYDASPQNEVRSLVNQYSILRRKGLTTLGHKLLHRALQICEKNEFDILKVEVLHFLLSHNIMYGAASPWPGGSEDLLRQIGETSALAIEASTMRHEIELLRKQTAGLTRARTEEELEPLRKKIAHLQQYDTSRLRSFDTRYQYYQLLTNSLYLCGNIKEGLHYAGLLCNWLLENWHYAATKSTGYITAFYNKALYELVLFKPEIRASIAALERLIEKEALGNPKSNVLLRRLKLMEAWETGRYDEVQTLSVSLLDYLRENNELINRPAEEMICLHISACAFFATGNFQQSAKQLRLLLRQPDAEKEVSMSAGARILLLVVEFERGDRLGIDSQLRSTYRFLLQKKQLHKVEKAILDFLRKVSRKTLDEAALKEEFLKLKEEIEIALQHDSDDPTARMFDIVSYLESKISGSSFEELRNEKIAQRWKV